MRGDERQAQVLIAARLGDPEAFRSIWDTHAGPVAGFLRARGTPDVDEVVNDVFMAVLTGIVRFEGDAGDLRAWIFRIARNKRADRFRARARHPEMVSLDEEGSGRGSSCRVRGDVEEEAVASLVDDELRSLLVDLTPEQRDVVVLRFIFDLPLEQVAAAMDRPVGAVKALQHRALARLRKNFSPDPYPDGVLGTMS